MGTQLSKEGRKRIRGYMNAKKGNCDDKVCDLSSCELRNLPNGTFIICKKMKKESLLLRNNLLKNLKLGNNISSFLNLITLDLQNNRLTKFPREICSLKNLQTLNISCNAIPILPIHIGDLVNLHTFNAKDNYLSCIPNSIVNLKHLQMLDVSGSNKIIYLPTVLWKVRTLETLVLSNPQKMEYPPPSIAENGLEEIMKFMCKHNGVKYIPPACYSKLESASGSGRSGSSEVVFETATVTYENRKEEKQRQRYELTKKLSESKIEQDVLANTKRKMRDEQSNKIATRQKQFDESVLQQREMQESNRKGVLDRVVSAEINTSALVKDMVRENEKSRALHDLAESIKRKKLDEIEKLQK